jgi:hypothetical protein
LLPHTGRSIRAGITGVPGAGKSTLIESLGLIDPSGGQAMASTMEAALVAVFGTKHDRRPFNPGGVVTIGDEPGRCSVGESLA